MRIGILTYHRAHNYGAILQALATRIILQKLGHEVYYVDYWPNYHKEAYVFFSWHRLWKYRWEYLKNRILLHNEIQSRIAHFERDINHYIVPFCIPYNSKEEFDVVIYGSDQIWRRQLSSNQFNPVYFGRNNIKANRHVSYAASMGNLVKDPRERAKIKIWLSKFSKISVREVELQNYVKELGYNSSLVVDPTLLLSLEQWDNILHLTPIRDSGYVLFYNLNKDTFDKQSIEAFASKKGLRVLEVKGVAGKDSDSIISQCGPREFVSLIKYADFVFSSSYHGLLFSIIFHKEFYVSFRNNIGRANSILSSLGIEDRILPPCVSYIEEPKSINYSNVERILTIFRNASLNYLTDI